MAAAPLLATATLGALSLVAWSWLALDLDAAGRRADVTAFLAVLGVLFTLMVAARWSAGRALRHGTARSERAVVVTVVLFAVAFRSVMLLAGLPAEPGLRATLAAAAEDVRGQAVTYQPFLLYDNDVWRYLWDGHVYAAGLDPYRWTPAAIEAAAFEGDSRAAPLLADQRWYDIHDNVAFGAYRSVYPPLAQHLFRAAHALAPGSVLALKALLAGCDLLVVLLLLRLLERLGRPRLDVVLYAWNPLAIKEIAGSGHVDALAVMLTMATLVWLLTGRQARALLAFAGAVLAKLMPVLLLGLVLGATARRRWWLLPAAGLALAAPLLGGLGALADGLGAFGRAWTFNAGPWGLVATAAWKLGAASPPAWAHAICGGAVLALASALTVRALRQRGDSAVAGAALVGAAFVILAAVVWLSAAVMPWYVLWALPLAIAVGNRSWQAMSALVLLSYLVYADQRESTWWLLAEHGTFAVLAGVELVGWLRRRKGVLPALAASGYQRLPP